MRTGVRLRACQGNRAALSDCTEDSMLLQRQPPDKCYKLTWRDIKSIHACIVH